MVTAEGKMDTKIAAMKKIITLIMAGERYPNLLMVRSRLPTHHF